MADGSLKSGKLSTVRTVRNQAFATAIVIAIAIAESPYLFSMERLQASSITFCP